MTLYHVTLCKIFLFIVISYVFSVINKGYIVIIVLIVISIYVMILYLVISVI